MAFKIYYRSLYLPKIKQYQGTLDISQEKNHKTVLERVSHASHNPGSRRIL